MTYGTFLASARSVSIVTCRLMIKPIFPVSPSANKARAAPVAEAAPLNNALLSKKSSTLAIMLGVIFLTLLFQGMQ